MFVKVNTDYFMENHFVVESCFQVLFIHQKFLLSSIIPLLIYSSRCQKTNLKLDKNINWHVFVIQKANPVFKPLNIVLSPDCCAAPTCVFFAVFTQPPIIYAQFPLASLQPPQGHCLLSNFVKILKVSQRFSQRISQRMSNNIFLF